MADKFRNKYRIPSARLQNWDYGSNATYFITICTHDRFCFFGDIVLDSKKEMRLSSIGEIVESEWIKTFEIRKDMNLEMGAFVVMPNHFHAIIGIGKNEFNICPDAMHCPGTDAMHRVSAENPIQSLDSDAMHPFGGGDAMHRVSTFGPQSKNLASIIRGFKSAVTMLARQINPQFGWQPRFHDHIIRNRFSFQRIESYIINNPIKWNMDKFYKK